MACKNIKKLIFIVGCPRSGTTLLQNLLLNIPGSFSMPETHFFEVLPDNYYIATRSLPGFGKYAYPEIPNERTRKRIISSMKKNTNLNLPPELEKSLVSKEKKISTGEFFCELMNSYNKSGKDLLVEKTPNHIFHVPYIKALFPDAIIINIARDPRDVYASYLKFLEKQDKPKRTIAEFSHLWNKSIEYALNNNLPTIIYEELIKDPKGAVNKVLSNFGLAIESLEGNSYAEIVLPKETWKINVKSGVSPDNTRGYSLKLAGKEIAEIEKRCRKGMKTFGYQPDENGKYGIFFYYINSVKWLFRKLIIYKNIFKEKIKLIIK